MSTYGLFGLGLSDGISSCYGNITTSFQLISTSSG